MALKKQIQTSYGVPAEYHKIIGTSIDWLKQTAIITVGVFVDETARREGVRPIERRAYQAEPFPFDKTTPERVTAYEYLKALPKYEGAEDILEDEDDNN